MVGYSFLPKLRFYKKMMRMEEKDKEDNLRTALMDEDELIDEFMKPKRIKVLKDIDKNEL